MNQIMPGTQLKGGKSTIGSHPPKKRITVKEDIRIIFAYSPSEKRANPIAEYSTFYPDTSSASASGRSKGWRLVSARAEIKKIIAIGNKGIQNQTDSWALTTSVRFKEPAHKRTVTRMNPIETSYETI